MALPNARRKYFQGGNPCMLRLDYAFNNHVAALDDEEETYER